MINLDGSTNENNQEYSKKWPYVQDHSYRMLIIGGSGSRKTNALLHFIKEQYHVNKIYLHAKDLSKPKYDFFF